MINYFIFAGESSGDLHGSHLIKALKHSQPISIRGVGGPAMRTAGLSCILPMEEFQVMGFTDVIKSFPRLWRHFYFVCHTILETSPDCVILIDYPGFNLRLAKALRKKGFKGKIIQYICPTVWAHGKNRIETMVRTLDLLLTIFPFEASYFSHTPLKVQYIGNPLMDNQRTYNYHAEWKQHLEIPEHRPLVALFPGSRCSEIYGNLPLQLETATLLKEAYPATCFGLSVTQAHFSSTIKAIIQKTSLKIDKDIFLIPKQYTYELMQDSRTALAKSGTVTLELALHACPTLVTYQLTQINYLIAKHFLRLQLPHYCIVNILGKQEVFPEFIGTTLSSQQLFTSLRQLHGDEKIRQEVIENCLKIQGLLGQQNSSQLAAKAIQELK